MSIESTGVIDFASLNKSGNAVLTIADHLEWDKGNRHLLLLQEKINNYLNAIESGELYKQYPLAKGRKIIISLVLKYWPSPEGEEFLRSAQMYLSNNGYEFTYKKLIERPSNND